MLSRIGICLFGAGAVVLGAILYASAPTAEARPLYFNALKAKYPENKEIETAKCASCHVGKTKKERNDYGKAIGAGTGKDSKDKAKIEQAVIKAESKKAKGASETFGDRLKAGKLPVEAAK